MKTRQNRQIRRKKNSVGKKLDEGPNWRFLTGVGVLFLFALALLVRASVLQVFSDDRLRKLASRQYQKSILIRPRRGEILDRNGIALAVSEDSYSLAANPRVVPRSERRRLSQKLSRALRGSSKGVRKKLKSKRSFVWIARHVSDVKKNQIMKWKEQGIWLVREMRRTYPQGPLASHLLGSVNVDAKGIEGVELWMDRTLRGSVSSFKALRDAKGRPTFMDASDAAGVQNGRSVHLTLDSVLQNEVENHLRASIESTESKAGSVIVMDAVNGDLLAVANWPTFNSNKKTYRPKTRRNRAFTDAYEPGSTFKALILAAALEQGWQLNDRLWGEKGRFKIGRRSIREAHGGFGWMNLAQMIQKSSNVVAAKLALELGNPIVMKALHKFGLGARSGSGFPGEVAGWLPARGASVPEISLANIGFGHGIVVTPIQIARAFAMFANGGFLVRPRILQEKSIQRKSVLSQETADAVSSALILATGPDGTGRAAVESGFAIAGKTGTAQVVDSKTKTYSKTHYRSSFVGFAVEQERRIVILTLLDRPRGNYYASATAAPLFRKVFRSVATRLSLPSQPEWQEIYDRMENRYRRLDEKRAILVKSDGKKMKKTLSRSSLIPVKLSHNDGNEIVLPNLKGLSVRAAFRKLEGFPVQAKVTGQGVVRIQRPVAGTKLKRGERLDLLLATDDTRGKGKPSVNRTEAKK